MDTPPKKRKLSKPTDCMIHCTDSSDAIVTLDSYSSWQTLLNAARIRNHATILEISNEVQGEEVPFVQYHRKCRSIFTMKRELEKLQSSSQVSKLHIMHTEKYLGLTISPFPANVPNWEHSISVP